MDDKQKVYKPEEIADQPLPNEQDEGTPASSQSQGSEVYTQKVIRDKPIKKKVVAQETISQSINTKSKKITGEYQFTQQGAIKVGEFTEGVSGEIKISPTGLVARNKAGNVTIAIDGETGDVSIIGAFTGGSININNNFSVDSEGNAVANSIALSNNFSSAFTAALNQIFNSSSDNTVTNSTSTFTLERDTLILIVVNATGYVEAPSELGAWGAIGILKLKIDNVDERRSIISGGSTGTDINGSTGHTGMGTNFFGVLPAGEHTITLTGSVDSAQSANFVVYNYAMSVVSLGSPL